MIILCFHTLNVFPDIDCIIIFDEAWSSEGIDLLWVRGMWFCDVSWFTRSTASVY